MTRAAARRRLSSAQAKAVAIQAVGTALIVTLAIAAVVTAWQKLRAEGFAYGFDILAHPTGFSIVSPFLGQDASDPYWWTLTVGLVNTAAVGVVSIVLATLLGLGIGIGLRSGNMVLTVLCRIYVETFRNVPLVLQAVFWYVTFTRLPTPRGDPPSLMSAVFLTNKGVFVPRLVLTLSLSRVLAMLAVFVIGCLLAKALMRRSRLSGRAVCTISAIAVVISVVMVGGPTARMPRLEGFTFKGGSTISLEFLALTFAIVVFSAAYTAEIVRGALQSVPKGQVEAARALGLSPLVTLATVELPIALRAMVPPLGNQFSFIMKATALGLAVGYSDLFSTSVVSISQSGQSIEFLAVMMGAYIVLNYGMSLLVHWADSALSFKGAGR